MDVLRHGSSFLIGFTRVVGWVSWLIVATHLYAFAWWSIDSSSYFVLPIAVYEWFDDLVGTTTGEASFDLEVWSTSISMVLGLHLLTWIICSGFKHSCRESVPIWHRWQRRIFPVVGWGSWLLVSTCTLLAIGDAILRARGSELPSHYSAVLIEMIGGLLVVGLLHLAVLRIARRRPS